MTTESIPSEEQDITNEQGSNDENSDSDSDSFIPTDDAPIFVTVKAAKAFKLAIDNDGEEGDGLRVSVIGGGCSGFQYNLDFEKEERPDDTVMSCGGVTVYIDSVSAGYLRGTVVDYVTSLQGQGFKFINPNAKRTCGCGASFS
jgi:iron-sulfur cluster assembly accessory protein